MRRPGAGGIGSHPVRGPSRPSSPTHTPTASPHLQAAPHAVLSLMPYVVPVLEERLSWAPTARPPPPAGGSTSSSSAASAGSGGRGGSGAVVASATAGVAVAGGGRGPREPSEEVSVCRYCSACRAAAAASAALCCPPLCENLAPTTVLRHVHRHLACIKLPSSPLPLYTRPFPPLCSAPPLM